MPNTRVTIAQAATQLTRTESHWGPIFGSPATVTFGFRGSAPPYESNPYNLHDSFSTFTLAEMEAARTASRVWSNVANIHFSEVNPGGFTNSATILFGNFNTSAGVAGFAFFPGSMSASDEAGDVWINRAATNTTTINLGTDGFHTFLHELGHSLGLSHPGDYNAFGGLSYQNSAPYIEDSYQYSAMSYWSASETGANHIYNGRQIFPSTPMLHDIAAIQLAYGANQSFQTGDTVYGFNSNADSVYRLNSSTDQVVYAIWDGGGNDTFDFSGYNNNQTINLNQGSFSGIGALTFNVSIAVGAIIENAFGGSGNDTIIGNSSNNILNGFGGNNVLVGGAGWDVANVNVSSANAALTLNSDGSWTARYADGRFDQFSTIEALHFIDQSIGLREAVQNDFVGSNNSHVLLSNRSSGVVSYIPIDHGTSAGTRAIVSVADTVVGAGDFNGNGTADVLLRSGNGNISFVSMVGGSGIGTVQIGTASLVYSVVGIGDFNGDGTSDILFRNNSVGGDTGYYRMVGGVFSGWGSIGSSNTVYSVVGIGDFSGDGTSDVLFRDNTTGDTGYYRLTNGTFGDWGQIGSSNTSYSVDGVGDFSGDGISDVLFRNNSTGDTGFYRIVNGTFGGWGQIGSSNTAYSIVDVGDYNGDGTADILFRNPTTNDLGYYQIDHGQFAGWIGLAGLSAGFDVV